jgi:hypothetical protein
MVRFVMHSPKSQKLVSFSGAFEFCGILLSKIRECAARGTIDTDHVRLLSFSIKREKDDPSFPSRTYSPSNSPRPIAISD